MGAGITLLMTQAAPVFQPVASIADSVGLLFGPEHADRWIATVAASDIPPTDLTWRDIGAIFTLWLAHLEDETGVLESIREVRLSEIQQRGTDGCFTSGPEVRSTAAHLAFIHDVAADAVAATLANPDHAEALQCIVLREDCQGASAAEVSYLIQGVSVTAVYGDPLSPTMLQSQRAMSGHAIRIIHKALADADAAATVEATQAEPEAPQEHGVGATGPVIPASGREN